MKQNLKNLTLSAMFLALGLILPFLTGQIPQIGSMLSPMHIPVLLCGMVCGWPYGLAVGAVMPLLRGLLENHVRVRIVERDPARCDVLAQALPEAQILCEDGSNREFLLSEGLTSTEAFVALTNIDEENVLLTLFAKKHSNGKLVTKINRLEFDDILAGLDLGSIVYPKYMTCDYIVQYVRALQNEAGNNIKTLYRILDDRVEALEFTVHEESKATGVPLSQLHLKKNLLLCCITRGNEIRIPRGGDQIQVGDNVIVVTLEHGLHDLRDIVED